MVLKYYYISLQLWANYEEPKEEEVVEEPAERVVSYRNILVTEVQDDLKFYAQTVENGRLFYIHLCKVV